MKNVRFLLVLALAVVFVLPGMATADLIGPTVYAYDGTTYTDFGTFINGGTSVTISSNSILAHGGEVGGSIATGSLTWTGTGLVSLCFDYSVGEDPNYNDWVRYGDAGKTLTTITTSGTGHVDEIFNLDTFTVPLLVQAYAYGPCKASISNLCVNEVSAVPLPPSALLLGSGIVGIVGLGWNRRKRQQPRQTAA